MKNIIFFVLALSISLVNFLSCGKVEADQTTVQSDFYENLQGEEYLNYYETPEVFFNLAKIDEASQVISGWIIPTDGKLYTYEIPVEEFSVVNPILKRTYINELMDKAVETDHSIDLVELIDYYKKTRIAANGDFDLGHGEALASTSYYFIAYDLKLGNGECLYCPISQVSEDEVAQLVLKAEGTLKGMIDHSSADQIIEWMQGIDEGF